MATATVCDKCKTSLQRLMVLALLEDLGCKASQSATDCSMGGEHDFVQKKIKEAS